MNTMSRSVLLLAPLALILTGAATAGAPASDWPQWRGPHRDAVSGETDLIESWGEDGPAVDWRIDAGEGFSSVSVSAGRLYTLWDERGKQLLVSLAAKTGLRLWTLELGPAFKNNYGNGPRSTPTVDGDLVYAIGTRGVLIAANKRNGKVEWRKDLVGDFGSDLPSYGYSSSPLIVGDRLIVEVGGSEASVVAFDKRSGEVVWAAGSDRPAYSSPIELTVDGLSQVVFWSAHGLHAFASEDGRPIWDYGWETFCPVSGDPLNTGTPIFIQPDRVFISSGSGAAVIRIVRDGRTFRVEEVWKSEAMRSDVNTALLLDNHIYGFDRGTLKSLNAATGEVEWKARGFQRGSLIAADGKLIVLGEQGNLALLEADPENYVERAAAALLAGKNWTAPTLAGGKLYLRNHDELVCVDMRRH
jgi:outer membrane protein assembly factor BamB